MLGCIRYERITLSVVVGREYLFAGSKTVYRCIPVAKSEIIPMVAFERQMAGIETGCGVMGSVDRKSAFARFRLCKVSDTISVVIDTATGSVVAEVFGINHDKEK